MNIVRILTFTASILMIPLLQGCLFAAAGGAATGATVATDRRTTGTIVDDQTIELKAMHAIGKNHTLWEESHISVVSYNNVVLLVGQTPSETLKREAEEAVSSIPKVRQVHNELSIGSPASLGTRSKDSWITTQIKTKIIGNRELKSARIKVITEEGVVYLMGITTPEEEQISTEIAQGVSGVEKVVQIFETKQPESKEQPLI